MEQDRPEEVQHAEDGNEAEELIGTPVVEEALPEWKWMPMSKAGYIFTGVILPIICFLLVGSGFPSPLAGWQTGELSDYCQLLLFSLESCLPFYPFLLYAMACMTCMVVRPERYSQQFMVRLGIYMGVGLALQYFILLVLTIPEPVDFTRFPLLAIFLWGGAWLIAWLLFRRGVNGTVINLSRVAVIAAIIMVCVFIPSLCFWIALVSSTTWAIIAYSMMSWRLLRRGGRGPWQFSLAQLFVFVTWLAAYCSAWRMSVMLMLAEYAKLPTSPPERCYVCTAAARGHRWIVGSQAVRADANNVYRINDQTRYLKAAEITLAATCPRMHHLARAVYDRMGPPAARLLVHPLAADAAYLAMKPAEWAARAFFAAALPEASRLARRLYRRP